MRKSQILSAVEQELERSDNLDKKILEINFKAIDNSKNKDRLAFCFLDCGKNFETVIKIIEAASQDYFIPCFEVFDNINKAKVTHASTLNDPSIIENNWRGRLFSMSSLSDYQASIENARNFLFRSIWRIIIQRDTNLNYYVRHDIFPYFWSPGHSTGGKKDYKESVTKEFWNVAEPKVSRQDIDFDLIKVFAQKAGRNNFDSVPFSPPAAESGQEVYEVDFQSNHEEKNKYLENLLDRLENSIFH